MQLVVQRYELTNPVWNPAAPATPGQQVTLQVTAPDITPQQHIEFRIVAGAELIAVLHSAAGQATAQWRVPNLPTTNNVTFTAIRREKPTPANGHQTALGVSPASAALQLQGFSVQITTIDAAFVPSQENLETVFAVTDPGGAAASGRYEIWGERYPGDDPKPLYTENFVPAAGNTTWNSWNGQPNAGLLSGHFLTPEFSPYKLRICIGPDQASVDAPYGAGLGFVACAESQFEVKFTSIEIRLQAGVTEKATDANYQFASTLMIQPLGANGNYHATGRLPIFKTTPPVTNETMRLRIPVARNQAKGDPLNQDRGAAPHYMVGTGYTTGGKTPKFEIDQKLYSRPEIPVEFIPRLTSRTPAANPDGLVQADAVGAPIIEPVAEEYIDPAILAAGGVNEQYWRNAAFKIKKGKHQSPWHNANNNPEFHYWTARLVVANDGDQDFDVQTFDNTLGYLAAAKELKVYLNRTLLTFSDRADDNDLNIGKKDYREVSGGPPSKDIRLRPNLAKQGDILWVIREDSTASGDDKVEKWANFPPGPNCHLRYGGVRGEIPTKDLSNYFRAAYSKQQKKRKSIVGLATAEFLYKKFVDLKPDDAEQKIQERVETTVMPTGAQQGMAGVIFSPSFIAGDRYILWAWMEREAYRRRFGFIEEKPALKGRTGTIDIWRWARIKDSFRLPDIGTNGLAATVGGEAEAGGGGYPANGVNMTLLDGGPLALSTVYLSAFHDWSKIPPSNPPPGGAGNHAVHASINLAAYRGAHNSATSAWAGHFPMNADTDVKNYSVAWDYYRASLPPGLPALPNLIANTIAAQAAGSSARAVGLAVRAAINAHGAAPDVALNGGVSVIPPSALSVSAYTSWFDRKWDEAQAEILDALIPKVTDPEFVNVVRWPTLHEHSAWKGWNAGAPLFNTMMTLGFSSGDAQSMFRTANLSHGSPRAAVNENTFPHEMGHALNLAHFVAENFAWKHHDVNHPDCLMSYTYTTGFIRRNDAGAHARGPGGTGAVSAAGGTPETGFPHVVPVDNPPGAPFPSPAAGATAANSGDNCIQYGPGLNPVTLCAKCALKLRGWNDELLPFAWRHPDLF